MPSPTYHEPARDIPVFGEYDVVVVGGGCAGFAAAVAAAREGASTLVIERFPFFGGTLTASLMPNINGFRNQVAPDGLQTSRGIAEELVLRLIDIHGTGVSPYEQKPYPGVKGSLAYSYAVDPEKFKYVTLAMVNDAGVKILFHTWFSAPIVENGSVRGVVIENKSGRQAVLGRVTIDASGDGDVASRAGARFRQIRHSESKRLADNLMYRIANIPPGFSNGCIAGSMMTVWGPLAGEIDATDAQELTDAEVRSRLAVYEDFEKRKKEAPELADAVVAETPPLLGVRQTRFVEGLYTITVDDILAGRRFDDNVAMASCPIINYFGYRRYLEHEGYGIPYRCLVPKDVNGLLVAGRCMSSDQPAYESWRAMAPVMSIGEAAGVAAAICAKASVEPRSIDVARLQERLAARGAEIGRD